MYSNNKQIRDVANIAAQIMSGQQPVTEKLHPNQQKLDVHEPEKDELTAKDFEMLRAKKGVAASRIEQQQKKKMKEDADPCWKGYKMVGMKDKNGRKVPNCVPGEGVPAMKKEEAEQLKEYQSKGGVYKHKGTYGTEKSVEAGYTDYDKENEMAKKLSKPAKKKYGARQNFVRSTRVNESFTEILSQYKEGGLKNLFESFKKEEQVLSEEVQEETVQVEVTDFDAVNGVTIETIEERTLTEPETKKKEEVVKSMKKGISGFKARYGDDAKSVMYATATARAKEKA